MNLGIQAPRKKERKKELSTSTCLLQPAGEVFPPPLHHLLRRPSSAIDHVSTCLLQRAAATTRLIFSLAAVYTMLRQNLRGTSSFDSFFGVKFALSRTVWFRHSRTLWDTQLRPHLNPTNKKTKLYLYRFKKLSSLCRPKQPHCDGRISTSCCESPTSVAQQF